MYYITVNAPPKSYQLTFDDIIAGRTIIDAGSIQNTHNTVTRQVDSIPDALKDRTDFMSMCWAITAFNKKYADLEAVEDKHSLYHSFKIPKRNGKLRQIDAPKEELKSALDELKGIFERVFYTLYHTSAFAYVKNRSTVMCVKRHQHNESKWFLKLDFHGFFPSTTQKFVVDMLGMQFPFCVLFEEYKDFKPEFEKALSLCFLDGGLPQGTPTSPLLTNLMMIPIDHTISKYCREHSPHLLYTRYADDIDISCQIGFLWTEVQEGIVKILSDFNAPFELNKEKTHYGSSSGRNWMLGLMLNKDNDITIGYEKKKRFKAMLFSFLTDYKTKRGEWDFEDVQHLNGVISYYRSVEEDKINALIEKYSKDFSIDVEGTIRSILSGRDATCSAASFK